MNEQLIKKVKAQFMIFLVVMLSVYTASVFAEEKELTERYEDIPKDQEWVRQYIAKETFDTNNAKLIQEGNNVKVTFNNDDQDKRFFVTVNEQWDKNTKIVAEEIDGETRIGLNINDDIKWFNGFNAVSIDSTKIDLWANKDNDKPREITDTAGKVLFGFESANKEHASVVLDKITGEVASAEFIPKMGTEFILGENKVELLGRKIGNPDSRSRVTYKAGEKTDNLKLTREQGSTFLITEWGNLNAFADGDTVEVFFAKDSEGVHGVRITGKHSSFLKKISDGSLFRGSRYQRIASRENGATIINEKFADKKSVPMREDDNAVLINEKGEIKKYTIKNNAKMTLEERGEDNEVIEQVYTVGGSNGGEVRVETVAEDEQTGNPETIVTILQRGIIESENFVVTNVKEDNGRQINVAIKDSVPPYLKDVTLPPTEETPSEAVTVNLLEDVEGTIDGTTANLKQQTTGGSAIIGEKTEVAKEIQTINNVKQKAVDTPIILTRGNLMTAEEIAKHKEALGALKNEAILLQKKKEASAAADGKTNSDFSKVSEISFITNHAPNTHRSPNATPLKMPCALLICPEFPAAER